MGNNGSARFTRSIDDKCPDKDVDLSYDELIAREANQKQSKEDHQKRINDYALVGVVLLMAIVVSAHFSKMLFRQRN